MQETSTNGGPGAAVRARRRRRGRARRAGALSGSWSSRPRAGAFTADYKVRALGEADARIQPGGVGELLRREGLYVALDVLAQAPQRRVASGAGKPRRRKSAELVKAQEGIEIQGIFRPNAFLIATSRSGTTLAVLCRK